MPVLIWWWQERVQVRFRSCACWGKPWCWYPRLTWQKITRREGYGAGDKQAAVMVKDAEVVERLGEVMERLLQDDGERKSLSEHILTLAMKDSDEMIAREILKIV